MLAPLGFLGVTGGIPTWIRGEGTWYEELLLGVDDTAPCPVEDFLLDPGVVGIERPRGVVAWPKPWDRGVPEDILREVGVAGMLLGVEP